MMMFIKTKYGIMQVAPPLEKIIADEYMRVNSPKIYKFLCDVKDVEKKR